MVKNLRIYATMEESYSNGPFNRYCIWFQGCKKRCEGCFNPKTHPIKAGSKIKIGRIIKEIASLTGRIEGITLSGGEPLLQFKGVVKICKKLKKKYDLGIIIFTGFTKKELFSNKKINKLCNYCDLIIYGPYDIDQKCQYGLKGSANKDYLFLSNRYSIIQIEKTPICEFKINKNGEILMSGVFPSIISKGYK